MNSSRRTVRLFSLSIAGTSLPSPSGAPSPSRARTPIDALGGAWQGHLATESVAVIRDWIDQLRPGVLRRASTLL